MRSKALSALRMAGEFRSNLSLMERSFDVSRPQLQKCRSDCVHYLARNVLIYPPSMRAVGLLPGMSYLERKQVLGVSYEQELDPSETDFKQFMESHSRAARKSQWIWRCGQQALEMQKEKWFGFFVTLTVDPSRVADSQAMWEENREFRKYIRRIARVSCRACGQPDAIKRGVSVQQFVKYVGVIEHGKSRHHHHMHLLLWMRGVPASWKVCPNRGISDPRYRRNDYCKELSTYWPHCLPGLGRAKFFRHEGDIWSEHGFSLPWDAKKERTVRISGPQKAGVYIGKYMDKDDKAWLHRVKATRGLGMGLLRKTMVELSFQKVRALTWRPRTFDQNVSATMIHCVPNVLLRSVAKQELFVRQWASNSVDYQKLLQPSTGVFSLMLKSVRDGTNPRRMSSKELFDWVGQFLPAQEGYSDNALFRAWHEIGVNFPPDRSVPVNHTGIT